MGSELVPTNRQLVPVAANPQVMAAVEKYGQWIYDASIFGAKTKGQAMMMAWSWIMRGKDPLEMKRQYHFIKGELTMKYRVMASHFLKAGGTIKPVMRTPELATVDLTYKGVTTTFSYSLKEAIEEDYLWTQEAANGKVPKKLKDGSLNRAALKDNWSTPRRRMQMLWSRAITDGIATIAADVTDGYYASEEMGEIIEDEAALPDESFTDQVERHLPPMPSSPPIEDAVFEAKEPKEKEQVAQDEPRGSVIPDQAVVSGGQVSQGAASPPKGESRAEEKAEASREVVRDRAKEPATPEQLAELKQLKVDLGIGAEAWKQMLVTYSVGSANQLKFSEADDFTVTLMRIKEERRLQTEQAGFFSQS